MTYEYIAGFFDGEGHCRRSNYKNGRGEDWIAVTMIMGQSESNNGLDVLTQIKDFLGIANQLSVTNKATNPHYRLEIRGKKAEEVLLKLLPYCIVKQKQIKQTLNLTS